MGQPRQPAVTSERGSLITKHLAAAAIGALTLTVPHVSTRAPEVKVLSAVGMRQVMRDLGPKFERATGYKLSMAFDSTGAMAQRVASGEQVDVVLLNQSAIGALEKQGKVIASSITPIAGTAAAKGVIRAKGMEPMAKRLQVLDWEASTGY
jgi:ABC-type molybdate transport system substrate-binding protein